MKTRQEIKEQISKLLLEINTIKTEVDKLTIILIGKKLEKLYGYNYL